MRLAHAVSGVSRLVSCLLYLVYFFILQHCVLQPFTLRRVCCVVPQEDAALVEKRSFLLMRQQRLKAALAKIDDFAPDVLAVSK